MLTRLIPPGIAADQGAKHRLAITAADTHSCKTCARSAPAAPEAIATWNRCSAEDEHCHR
jgi:hypothetical protein